MEKAAATCAGSCRLRMVIDRTAQEVLAAPAAADAREHRGAGGAGGPVCLSMDSDTETPRKGLPTAPCEVVRSSLSPRPNCDPDADLQAPGWVDPQPAGATPLGGGGRGCIGGRGACFTAPPPADAREEAPTSPASAKSPPKSMMLSQTQHYESPSRRCLAQFQAKGGEDSQSTLVYAAGSAGADSQRTLLYAEPQQMEPDGGPAPRDDVSSLHACEGGVGRARAACGALCLHDCTGGSEQETESGAENACYRALPDMPSQLTPASQGQSIISQTQNRYAYFSSFGPEMLHERAPCGGPGRAHLSGSDLRSRESERGHGSEPAAYRCKEQHALELMPGSGAQVEGHGLSTGSSARSVGSRSQSSPAACKLSASKQGPQGSLSPSEPHKSGEEESKDCVQGAAEIQHTCSAAQAAVPSRNGGGRAEQLRREKAMVHELPALDDLMSQDVRFAVPAQRKAVAPPSKSCDHSFGKIMQAGPAVQSVGGVQRDAVGGDGPPETDSRRDTQTKQAQQSARPHQPTAERSCAGSAGEANTEGGTARKCGGEAAAHASRSPVKIRRRAAQDRPRSIDDSMPSGRQSSAALEAHQESKGAYAPGSEASVRDQDTAATDMADNLQCDLAAARGQSGNIARQSSPAQCQVTDAAPDETLDEVSQESPVRLVPPLLLCCCARRRESPVGCRPFAGLKLALTGAECGRSCSANTAGLPRPKSQALRVTRWQQGISVPACRRGTRMKFLRPASRTLQRPSAN